MPGRMPRKDTRDDTRKDASEGETMPCNTTRNLDISALRSFVMIAELGGVTRAAERLNLTQSAVSMQLKRLETAFDQPLVAREGRGVTLTEEGEQLLAYGRRMVRLNDETWNRMMHEMFQGRITFGVPEDIVRPYVTGILRDFVGAFPRARINLVSSITRLLIPEFAESKIDIMLTTEPVQSGTGECLYRGGLKWYVGRDSKIYEQRPLPLASKQDCVFLPVAAAALDAADIHCECPYQANDWRDLVAFVSAGLAIETNMPYMARIKDWDEVPAGAGLPALPDFGIFLYVREGASPLALQLAGIIRDVDFDPAAMAKSA